MISTNFIKNPPEKIPEGPFLNSTILSLYTSLKQKETRIHKALIT